MSKIWIVMSVSLYTTAWHVLRLKMKEQPADMEGSCGYIE
jgi:hypothetical protein